MIKDIKLKYDKSSIFTGVIGYRDHCDSKVTQKIDLNSDS